MNLVFNELSIHPIAENGQIIEESFKKLLLTFKEAKKVYGFKHISFPNNHATLQVTTTETFYEWVSSLTNSTFKNLIIDLFKKPFTDELEEAELDAFFESDYTLLGENMPTEIEPVGLPVSHIKAVPTISLDSHLFWRNRKIIIRKKGTNSSEDIDVTAYNICLVTDIVTTEMIEWADKAMPRLIDNEEILTKYLGFTKYQPVFVDNFMGQLLNWKSNDFDKFKYILLLMKNVQIHPFTGGMGQTENLIKRGKEASKRINNRYPNADRLSYTVENNIVTFIACAGHYKFH